MAITVTHNTVVAVPDDGTSPVGSDEWNAAHTVTGTERTEVTSARTYYVNNDTGSDANDGLSSPNAFATIQHACDVVCDTLYIKAEVSIEVEYTGTNYDEWVKLRAWQGFPRSDTNNNYLGTVQIYSTEANGGTINQPVGDSPDINYFRAAFRAEGVGASWKITNISSDLSLATTYEVGHFQADAGAHLIVEGGHLSAVLDGGSGTAYFLAVNRSDIKWVNGSLGYSSHLYDGGVASSLYPILGQAYYSSRCEIDRTVVFDDDPAFWLVLFAQIESSAWYGHNFSFSGTVTGQYFSMRDGSHGSSGNLVDLPGDSFTSAGSQYPIIGIDATWDNVGIYQGDSSVLSGGIGTVLDGYLMTVSDSNTNVIGAEITGTGAYHVLACYVGGNYPSGTWVVAAAEDALSGYARLDTEDQVLTGGARVTSKSLSTGSITIDPGDRPIQHITNGGAFTLTAPANDGSCMVLVTNNGSAGAITFSGFSVGANTGDALTTTDTHKFTISVWRINSVAGYRIAAHQ